MPDFSTATELINNFGLMGLLVYVLYYRVRPNNNKPNCSTWNAGDCPPFREISRKLEDMDGRRKEDASDTKQFQREMRESMQQATAHRGLIIDRVASVESRVSRLEGEKHGP